MLDLLTADESVIIWADLLQPARSDLDRLAEQLDLHPLAVEDAVAPRERTTLDRYRSHLFANIYAITFDAAGPRVDVAELSAFILPAP